MDPELRDAARGMGMTPWQQVRKVEVPVAMPLIVLGLRTGAIFVVATATIAAYIGLGGLGRYIIDGLAVSNYGEVAGGALFVVLLALAVQALFVGVRRAAVPEGPAPARARVMIAYQNYRNRRETPCFRDRASRRSHPPCPGEICAQVRSAAWPS